MIQNRLFAVVSVLVLSACAGIYWAIVDPSRAMWVVTSVLVATCPCAFSLATPVALTAATGELARSGAVTAKECH